MAEYRVLAADNLSDEGLAVLAKYPEIEVKIISAKIDKDTLRAELLEADALLVRSQPKVPADVMEGNKRCKVMGRAGIGVDNIDTEAATANGVIVMNTPGGNSITTAEHALAMLFAVARGLPQAHAKLQAGDWDKKSFVGAELNAKTLGVVGLGNIGAIVADRARGLKMNVIGYDPFLTEDKADELGVKLVSLEEIYKQADFITLHVPMTDDTRGMIGKEQFAMMKSTARLVNCARGGIVDEEALLVALDEGQIAGAAFDVYATEPLPSDSPLLGHAKLITTPHLGASTVEAQVNVSVMVARQVAEFLVKGDVRNAVNAPSISGETVRALGAHLELGRKIGGMHRQLQESACKKVEIKLSGEIASLDFEPVVREVLVGLLDGTVEQPVNVVNVRSIATRRGIEVQVSSTKKGTTYTSSVEVVVSSDTDSHTLAGAVFGADDARIVRFDDFLLEGISLGGTVLALYNDDKPGVIGAVGGFLGENAVNIAQMQVSRNRHDSSAMMFVELDGEISLELLQEMEKIPSITWVKVLHF